MNSFLKYAIATAIVLGCSITESQAQQVGRGQVVNPTVQVNRTVINNVYRGGYGYGYGYRNGVGNWPGSGPYDSMIAVTGIAAGASIINNLINSTAQPRYPQPTVVYQQPQVVYAPAPQTIVVQPAPQVVYQQPAYPNLQGACQSYITGQNPQGGNVYVSTCH